MFFKLVVTHELHMRHLRLNGVPNDRPKFTWLRLSAQCKAKSVSLNVLFVFQMLQCLWLIQTIILCVRCVCVCVCVNNG